MREFKKSGFVLLIIFASYCANTFALTFGEHLIPSGVNGLKASHRSERDADIKHDVAVKVSQ